MLLSKLLIFILLVSIFPSDELISGCLESEESVDASSTSSPNSKDLVPHKNPSDNSQLNQKIKRKKVNKKFTDHSIASILDRDEKQNEQQDDTRKTEKQKDAQDESQETNLKRKNSSDFTVSGKGPKEKKRKRSKSESSISSKAEMSSASLFSSSYGSFETNPQPSGAQNHSTNSEENFNPNPIASSCPSESESFPLDKLYPGYKQGKEIQSICIGSSGHYSGNSDLPKEAAMLIKDEEKKSVRLYISYFFPQPIWFSSSPLKAVKGVIKLRFIEIHKSSLDFKNSFKKHKLKKIPSVVDAPESYRVLIFSDNLKDSFVPRSILFKSMTEGKLDPKIASFIESSEYCQKQDKKVEAFNKSQFTLFVFRDLWADRKFRLNPCCFSKLRTCFFKWREGIKNTDLKSDWEKFKETHKSENYQIKGKIIPDLSRLLNFIDLVYCVGIKYSGLFLERVPSKNDNIKNSYDVNVETISHNTEEIFDNNENFSLKKFQLRVSSIKAKCIKKRPKSYRAYLGTNTIEMELELGIE